MRRPPERPLSSKLAWSPLVQSFPRWDQGLRWDQDWNHDDDGNPVLFHDESDDDDGNDDMMSDHVKVPGEETRSSDELPKFQPSG